MGSRLVLVLVVALAGCGARLDENLPGDAPGGDGTPVDAAEIDAPPDAPIDARPCAGGSGAATDQSGTCFVFFSAPLTWNAAQAACVANSSQLAMIKSAQTNQVVTSLIGNADAFVGANDRVTEMTFVWLDGTGLAGYSNWRDGEPNNGSTNGEDCMIVEGDRGGTWDDRPCEPPPVDAGAYAYVCQY